MHLKIATLVLLLTCFLSSHAKNDYSRGYIITNNLDTLKGYIYCGTTMENEESCKYKATLSDQVQIFLPGQLSGFGFLGLNTSLYKAITFDLNGKSLTAFLKMMVQGNMSLYTYKERNNHRIFLLENPKGQTVSILKQDLIKIQTNSKTNKDTQQANFLELFKNEQKMGTKGETTLLKSKDLTTLSNKYYKLKNQEPYNFVEDPTIPHVHFDYTIYGGMEYCFYSRTNLDIESVNSNPLKNETSPMIGNMLDVSFPKLTRTWSVQFDLFTSRKYSWYIPRYGKDYHPSLFLNTSIGPKYTFQTVKFKPSISVGMGWDKRLTEVEQEIINYNTYTINVGLNPKLSKSKSLMINLGYRKQSGFATEMYETPYGIHTLHKNATNSTGYIRLGYTF